MKSLNKELKNIEIEYSTESQYCPAIIKWKCPICGYENIVDMNYQSYDGNLKEPFVIDLYCDNTGCKYQFQLLVKAEFKLKIIDANYNNSDEFEKEAEEYYHKDGKYEAFHRELIKGGVRFIRRTFND